MRRRGRSVNSLGKKKRSYSNIITYKTADNIPIEIFTFLGSKFLKQCHFHRFGNRLLLDSLLT